MCEFFKQIVVNKQASKLKVILLICKWSLINLIHNGRMLKIKWIMRLPLVGKQTQKLNKKIYVLLSLFLPRYSPADTLFFWIY